MSILCILPGPSHELRRKPAGDLWCFGCRKRLPHDAVLMGDPMPPEDEAGFQKWLDDGYGYYEPSWSRKCSGCGQDRTSFPGWD